MSDWRPTADLAALRRRARMLAEARKFFAARGVLEVETPILSAGAVSDPQIESLGTCITGTAGGRYLSTSPEYPMKRLLAAGSGDIFQICKVFRDAEHGRWHNPEFTMLEWYRLGMDDTALMSEVDELARSLLAPERVLEPALRLTYAEALGRHAGVDPHRDDEATLERAASRHGIEYPGELDRDARLDLLMGMVVGPKLGRGRPVFICDYPATQASLARLKPGLPAVAARFELYLDGIELANGFHELADAAEQRRRFAQDLRVREMRGQRSLPMDERLLAALEHGMPECAGVALGFDRLAALGLGADSLAKVIAFPIDNA